jgi:hypothetical protein
MRKNTGQESSPSIAFRSQDAALELFVIRAETR